MIRLVLANKPMCHREPEVTMSVHPDTRLMFDNRFNRINRRAEGDEPIDDIPCGATGGLAAKR